MIMNRWKTLKQKPSKSGIYLVTKVDATHRGSDKRWLDLCRYNAEEDLWYCAMWEQVIAWKNVSETYKGEWK